MPSSALRRGNDNGEQTWWKVSSRAVRKSQVMISGARSPTLPMRLERRLLPGCHSAVDLAKSLIQK